MGKSKKIDELAKALVLAQPHIKNVTKDKSTDKHDYASLPQVLDAIKAEFNKVGLAITQFVAYQKSTTNGKGWAKHGVKGIAVETILLHTSGQYIANEAAMPIEKIISKFGKETQTWSQAAGATISYLRRYSLMALAGIAQVDETAEEAGEAITYAVPITTESVSYLEALFTEAGIGSDDINKWFSNLGCSKMSEVSEVQAQAAIKKLEARLRKEMDKEKGSVELANSDEHQIPGSVHYD